MYRCYNLICETEEKLVELLRKYFYYSDFHNNELSEEEKKEKKKRKSELENYICTKHIIKPEEKIENILDADLMRKDYFPFKEEFDIFLSHSHQDKKTVLILKNFFETKLGLRVFVDSCAWQNCNELLKQIDDEYCLNPDQRTYSYPQRNKTTAAVYMMLSTALTQMMDHCDCVIFLNTPQSNIADADSGTIQTLSPWLYHELSTVNLLRCKTPKEMVQLSKGQKSVPIDESRGVPPIKYTINQLDKMQTIQIEKLVSYLKNKPINKYDNNPRNILIAMYKYFDL